MRQTADEKAIVIKLLSQAFETNQSVNYIVKQDNKKQSRIRALMDYSFEICSMFGEVIVSEDKKACALILYPQQKRTTLKSIWLDLKLIFSAIGFWNINKALTRESLINKLKPKKEMVYLWFIGVAPDQQHKGLGSKMLEEILDNSKRKNLPIFLETSTLTNLPWYERFGFEIYNQLDLGYKLFFLKNERAK
jgi:predicted N-acetyltransferase YhbS